jgi:hypothetical protein
MPSPPTLTLYDISSPLSSSYAPNPSKTRLALSFKRIPFTTTFIDIPAIPAVRQSLNCPATRKLDDGSDFYTLPILKNEDTGEVIGDSLDIAEWLEREFGPGEGYRSLFPESKNNENFKWQTYISPAASTPFFAPLTSRPNTCHPLYANFNVHVDATFSAYMVLYGEFLPLNPESADEVKRLMCKRAHLESWDQISMRGEAREGIRGRFREDLGGLAGLYGGKDDGEEGGEGEGQERREGEGVFLDGRMEPSYADLIVGGWLNMLSCTMPAEEWEDFGEWHGGVFKRVHDKLKEEYWVCT